MRQLLPLRRGNEIFVFQHNGRDFTATVSKFSDGRMAELFLDFAKPNSELAEFAADGAVLVSLLLQHGVSVAAIKHSISGPLSTALAIAEV